MGFKKYLAAIGPGLIVAATGVGAGDLATAAFSGSRLGTAVLWAVFFGALLKFSINEGLARWQLATGETALEAALRRLGRPAQAVFFVYLIPWSFFVGSALMSGCGVAAHALLPLVEDPVQGKVLWALIHSAAGVGLVRAGGFKLFEKVMSAAIGLMFVAVLGTAFLTRPDWGQVASGIFIWRIPEGGLSWTVALIGGVGGTLTVLCYGYWIREAGRTRREDLSLCRVDLGVGYLVTALFGAAMVVIGSRIESAGSGAGLIVALAGRLEEPLGIGGRWIFLGGTWAAIASSLLGVWQSVPYLFADFWSLAAGDSEERRARRVREDSATYRGYLYALAIVPALGLWVSFKEIQKLYAIVGASFMPLLALLLLWLNGKRAWVGEQRNGVLAAGSLVAVVLFFAYAGWMKVSG